MTRRSVAIDFHSVTLVPTPVSNRSWYGSFVTPVPFTHVPSARWNVTAPAAVRQPPSRQYGAPADQPPAFGTVFLPALVTQ